MSKVYVLLLSVMCLLPLGCRPSQGSLSMKNVPNYNPSAGDHVLFLEFKIRKNSAGDETAELVRSVAGSGRVKAMLAAAESPYRIVAIPRYSTSHPEQEMRYEHPLFQSVEVSDTTGVLSRSRLAVHEGSLTIRLQDDPYLTRVDLYSEGPEKGRVLINTLDFKR
ncbi:hypothetical protein [Dyadobacter sandarakinus]|uniref:DUF5625 domain-containing protein n=1 Tax=Dyadobacter sandarakinus TaxID=2747268 RepID=A0ABX7I444_9BACT|nr:hypothetical protein [Dyadobacter sandarakinus]QRR00337.1 hypothetical protein HWI92_05155 [Dyadobacter sandarakinus]